MPSDSAYLTVLGSVALGIGEVEHRGDRREHQGMPNQSPSPDEPRPTSGALAETGLPLALLASLLLTLLLLALAAAGSPAVLALALVAMLGGVTLVVASAMHKTD